VLWLAVHVQSAQLRRQLEALGASAIPASPTSARAPRGLLEGMGRWEDLKLDLKLIRVSHPQWKTGIDSGGGYPITSLERYRAADLEPCLWGPFDTQTISMTAGGHR
jgi:hypothetical protein